MSVGVDRRLYDALEDAKLAPREATAGTGILAFSCPACRAESRYTPATQRWYCLKSGCLAGDRADLLARAARLTASANGAGPTHDGAGTNGRRPAAGRSGFAASPTAEPPPPLPCDVLPAPLAAYARAAARAIGCPADLVLLPLVVALAAAVGNRAALAIKAGMVAKTILFGATVGKPGVGKTPAAEAAFAEHRRRQDELAASWAADLATWDAQPAKERGPEPRMARVMVDDATLEALGRELAEANGLLNYRGELAAWLFGLSRYRRDGSDRPDWLKLWNGQAVDQARLSRRAAYVPNPHVCLFAETQPDRVKLLTAEAGNDGLLDRFLAAWPDAEPAALSDEPMPDPAPLRRAVGRLRAFPAAPGGGSWLVRPSADAYERYRAWHDETNLPALRDGEGAGAGWAAKAPMHLQRLALVLHLAWDGAREGEAPALVLSDETMARAVDLVEALRGHAARLVAATGAGSAAVPKAQPLPERVLGLLRRKGDWLSAEDAVRGIGNRPAEEVRAALADLVAAGSVDYRRVATATKPRDEWCAAGDAGMS